MQDVHTCVMGLDVHRDFIVACLAYGELGAKPKTDMRTFSTLAQEMKKLRGWIEETGCRHIAMESTGIYWQPVYDLLEYCFDWDISILVVNARHIRNVPGRKTDVRDAQWIASLLRAGLLRGSFIPDRPFRDLRHLTRYRKNIIRDIGAQKNRIDKYMQSAGFRFSAFLSDIFGVSGRNIIRHLIEYGEIPKEALNRCLKSKLRKRADEILVSLNDTLSAHGRSYLGRMFAHLEYIERHLREIEADIDESVAEHAEALQLLSSIPRVSKISASAIIAEIGTDMAAFPTSQHICSWAGLSPGNNSSAGKNKSTRVNKANPYLKSILCEVGWATAQLRTCYLSNWYWKLKQRRGSKRAVIAAARKILVLAYIILKHKTPYDETYFEAYRQRSKARRTKRMVNELRRLGFTVTEPDGGTP